MFAPARLLLYTYHDIGADPLPMASITSLSAADVRRLFSDDAVFYTEDAAVGERVKDMQQKGFPIESVDGLDFCKQNVFDDTVCRE